MPVVSPPLPAITPSVPDSPPPPVPTISTQPRLQIGARLAEYLLLIVGGSIVIFVLYLVALDGVTSNEVTTVYNRTFDQMNKIAIPHDASGADNAAKILQEAARSSTPQVSSADAARVRSVIEQLKTSKRVTGPNAGRLDVCVQYAEKSSAPATAPVKSPRTEPAQKGATSSPSPSPTTLQPSPAPVTQPSPAATVQPSPAPVTQPSPAATVQPSPAPVTQPSPAATVQPSPAPVTQPSPAATVQPSPAPVTQPSPAVTVQPPPAPVTQPTPATTARSSPTAEASDQSDTTERASAFEDCVQILNPLRLVSASEAIDLDRLRLMKEYAKDAHDHRQAFRSFWLQAAQLVLLNLLLPLLTALLGYIFGSQNRE